MKDYDEGGGDGGDEGGGKGSNEGDFGWKNINLSF